MNAGQEMDSARDCKYKFCIDLVMRKPEYQTNPVNYPFGIQFFLLLSILRTLRHIKGLSTGILRTYCQYCAVKKTTENSKNIETNAKKVRSNFIT